MRQTNLSLEKLLSELESPKLDLRRCLIINEIGTILLEKDDEEEKAEKALSQLLTSDLRKDRFLAFCFLSCTDDLEEETFGMVENFKTDPKNADLIELAKTQTNEWKAQYN